jgi:hypothetical protein
MSFGLCDVKTTPHNQGYHQACTGEERLTKENTQFEAQLQFVSDAVMAFAHAFRLLLSRTTSPCLKDSKKVNYQAFANHSCKN